jgi:hypothetical protein
MYKGKNIWHPDNPSNSWVAPEHARMSSCRRNWTKVFGRHGRVIHDPAGELVMPEPECLVAQQVAVEKLRAVRVK